VPRERSTPTTTPTDLRPSSGLANFYVPGYSEIAYPSHQLTRLNVPDQHSCTCLRHTEAQGLLRTEKNPRAFEIEIGAPTIYKALLVPPTILWQAGQWLPIIQRLRCRTEPLHVKELPPRNRLGTGGRHYLLDGGTIAHTDHMPLHAVHNPDPGLIKEARHAKWAPYPAGAVPFGGYSAGYNSVADCWSRSCFGRPGFESRTSRHLIPTPGKSTLGLHIPLPPTRISAIRVRSMHKSDGRP
jgi:hypothetical protein